MTACKADLTQLTDHQLQRRMASAYRKFDELRAEVRRRNDLKWSGFRPERLKPFSAYVTASFPIKLMAFDEEDAKRKLLDWQDPYYEGDIELIAGLATDMADVEIDDIEEVDGYGAPVDLNTFRRQPTTDDPNPPGAA